MSGRVEGKVALITGGARSQGRSHAVRLAQEGADIVTLDLCGEIDSIRGYYPGATHEDLEETVRLVEAEGRRIIARKADVRDLDQIEQVVKEGVEAFGGIDIVSANAGIFAFGQQTHLADRQEWQDVLDVNLTGVWLTCKAVIPHMIEAGRGGSIILTSSSAGIKGTPNVAAYTASKHGVVGLMKTLSLELGAHRIRVNSVHPSAVATPMILNEATYRLFLPDVAHPTKEDAAPVFQAALHSLPVPWVEAVDVSNALLFLASDEARYVTGLQFTIDAGFCVK